ncbi:AAA family ATPase [Alteribacter natronophilus]|uniref:AAA family ATPase n=1 Tax=Alteribacter natronophilus TaxID=2583810 RepID=UPI00110DEBC7|nr:AAA family ATPase [Alteribacter natronophilus]TMW70740.1 heme ABC transporter ATP-binding protein CcmA [Alteribacter natronophilus]
MHLKEVTLNGGGDDQYPFSLPLIQSFGTLRFEKPVTILVGDNGTGKTTLLEGIAVHTGSRLIGGENIDSDPSLEPARRLAEAMKLTWSAKTREGFFFRASDFISFTRRTAREKKESEEKLHEIRAKDPHSLEVLPYARTVSDLKHFYGDGLDVRSHGESFLDLFQARFRPGGLYLLDEPEAPLSPLKQLSLISMINGMTEENGQFIIATHSPILMAVPGADLRVIENGVMKSARYDELEHVRLTRDFLNNPGQFLRHL